MRYITKWETVCLKRETKSSWPVQREKASVSVVTWHDDCCVFCTVPSPSSWQGPQFGGKEFSEHNSSQRGEEHIPRQIPVFILL